MYSDCRMCPGLPWWRSPSSSRQSQPSEAVSDLVPVKSLAAAELAVGVRTMVRRPRVNDASYAVHDRVAAHSHSCSRCCFRTHLIRIHFCYYPSHLHSWHSPSHSHSHSHLFVSRLSVVVPHLTAVHWNSVIVYSPALMHTSYDVRWLVSAHDLSPLSPCFSRATG